ncbi:MAG: phosphatase PAP2 family protein [Prevotellaceae bacterium]|jgi:membrane-associated phospholipid phosphatase|nr:phosphatase PAP2 family protein [Prevotellaceae bacterium]
MLKYILILLILVIIAGAVRAQDSIRQASKHKHFPYKSQIFPVALVAVGTAAMWKGNREVNRWIPKTGTTADDYLQYVPMLGLYAANLAGVKAQNSVWTQTKYLALSQLLCAATVQTLKYTVREQRPNQGAHNSYPSGHTSVAFVGATVMYHEFKNTNKLVAYSGFVVATAVGILRQTNQRHWVSDVLAGAGIGVLSTNLIYYFEPLKNWQIFPKSDKISILPYYDGKSTGLSLSVVLNGAKL